MTSVGVLEGVAECEENDTETMERRAGRRGGQKGTRIAEQRERIGV